MLFRSAIMEGIVEATGLVAELARVGSRIAVSDAGAAAVLLSAAVRAASLNVYINARSMADRSCAEALTARADELVSQARRVADETFEQVEGGLR